MRGIVYTGQDVEVTDKLEVADPGPNQVKIKMAAAGVCHSDLSVINGFSPSRGKPRRSSATRAPGSWRRSGPR